MIMCDVQIKFIVMKIFFANKLKTVQSARTAIKL